ncbi:MAG: hypothetical protein JXR19_00095 [Bacteroidia bacterium]
MKTFITLLTAAMIMACNTNHNHDHLGIDLNDGEKWVINSEMTPHIQEAHQIFKDYVSSGNEDYKTLANNLKQQNKRLIKSCTMKGKSHDELHKWLHPHIGLIDQLADAENLESANEIIEKLEDSFNAFHVYFN